MIRDTYLKQIGTQMIYIRRDYNYICFDKYRSIKTGKTKL